MKDWHVWQTLFSFFYHHFLFSSRKMLMFPRVKWWNQEDADVSSALNLFFRTSFVCRAYEKGVEALRKHWGRQRARRNDVRSWRSCCWNVLLDRNHCLLRHAIKQWQKHPDWACPTADVEQGRWQIHCAEAATCSNTGQSVVAPTSRGSFTAVSPQSAH